jgi:methionyl-tRNA formyltransferase
VTVRVVFLGTPEFAVPSLDALARLREAGAIELAAVVTQPDRPGHRGRIAKPPVKERALALDLPVLQPARLGRDAVAVVIAQRPEALVWAAYGNLIPASLIDAVRGRALNVHASLLPRWRGAAPIARAILSGDEETGVTLMEGTAELDAGPILAQERVAIGPQETAGDLTARLAMLGGEMLERELPRYLRGELRGRPQDPSRASWAPKLMTADGVLDFERPAEELARRVRAASPEPGAFTTVRGQRVGITKASVRGGFPAEHGVLELHDGHPEIAAGAGWLRLEEVRPAGKRTMGGAEWARGVRDLDGARVPS